MISIANSKMKIGRSTYRRRWEGNHGLVVRIYILKFDTIEEHLIFKAKGRH